MRKIDILNLEWNNSDRDLHIVTPVLIYLNKKYELTFETKSIFNGYYYILKYRPRLLLLSNFQGAHINNEIVKLAYSFGIKVVTFISEGNVKKEDLNQYLFGWNKDNILYVDKMLLWSKRSEKKFLSEYPEVKNKIVAVGATGFDRYKLLNFEWKSSFLKQNKLKFEKIIGIAAWGFDHCFGDYYEKNKIIYEEVFGENQIKMHRKDLFKLQKIYKKLIENNRNILFILRYHPGNIDFKKNEFYGLEKYENVFISNKYKNTEYQISDLINISDLWIGYETSTALEAWLLNKQTFLINPTDKNFIRENVHKGSPIIHDEKQAQSLIDEYLNKGKIQEFENLQVFRDAVIKDVIEYGDGRNYIRAAKEIINVYNRPDKKIKYSIKIYIEALKQIIKLILSKTILKRRWPNLDYKSDFAKKYQEKYKKTINV